MWHKPICFCKSSFRHFFFISKDSCSIQPALGFISFMLRMIFAFSAEYLCNLTSPRPKPPFLAFQWKKNSPFSLHRTAECISRFECWLFARKLFAFRKIWIHLRCELKERLVHKWCRTLKGKVNLLFKRWDCDLRYPIKANCAETLTASSFEPLTASSASALADSIFLRLCELLFVQK